MVRKGVMAYNLILRIWHYRKIDCEDFLQQAPSRQKDNSMDRGMIDTDYRLSCGILTKSKEPDEHCQACMPLTR